MPRPERDFFRDHSYSLWHRSIEPEDSNQLPYVDIDAVEFCPRCLAPLALMELAMDVGQRFKPVGVTVQLAKRAHVPAYLVFYKTNSGGQIVSFRARQVWPPAREWWIFSPSAYADWLRVLRAVHDCPHRR